MDPSLYKAAAKGDIDTLKGITNLQLLVTPNKNTVLHIHITAQSGAKDQSDGFVQEILNMCPSLLLQKNAKGETPLHITARHGHTNTAGLLIQRAKALHFERERGVEAARQMLRMTNKQKDTALHEAVKFHHAGVVGLLLDEDPEFLYSANHAHETPLYLAAARGFYFMVYLMLKDCRPLAHGGPNAKTALHAAVIRGDEVISSLIVEWKTALAKEVDHNGWTPLHYAAHLGHVSLAKLLLKHDISVAYFPDREGCKTALHIAARLGHSNIVKELITRCPDCYELVDKRGRNVLHFAVESGDEKTVEVVLENSCPGNLINEKDNDWNTPLHYLAASRCYIPALIKHPKVDRMASNREGLSPLDIILAYKYCSPMKESILRDLKEACAGDQAAMT